MTFKQIVNWRIHDDIGRRKYLNQAERERFLAAANELDSRSRTLCFTLAYTGCRVSEALNLRLHQLDSGTMTLTICTLKRRRSVFRVIPIPETLVTDLHALSVDDEGHFWRIHRSTAWRLVKQIMDASAIAGPMACCKGLRHSFGILAASRGVPPNLIQRWMGHASGTTTAIYMDAVGAEERTFAAKLWP